MTRTHRGIVVLSRQARSLAALALSALAGCAYAPPGRMALNPPGRPQPAGNVEIGASAGALIPPGAPQANLWFRVGTYEELMSVDIAGFYKHGTNAESVTHVGVVGANLALRLTPYDDDGFFFQLTPGCGLGAYLPEPSIHVSPNLEILPAFKLGDHTLYLGVRTSFSLAPANALLVPTVYNSAGLGGVFTVEEHFHFHLEALAGAATELYVGITTGYIAPSAGFSADF